MDGVLNVYKEKGFTSHDVVAKLRGILRQKKIGHTGTLDPQAEGVLPVCLGSATKLCDMLTDHSKAYHAEFVLGKITDTQDIFGQVTEEREVLVTPMQIQSAIGSFTGIYEQVPPMYSAKKVGGRKLYELAREGKQIERRPSRVEIESIHITRIDLPFVEIMVNCSKGTYIRTLCHDIGQALGCGACMTKLIRTKVGSFSIDDALKLDEIEWLRDEQKLESVIVSAEQIFADYSRITVKPESARLLYNGNVLLAQNIEEAKPERDRPVSVYDDKGRFLAVYQWNSESENFKPIKMFLRSDL